MMQRTGHTQLQLSRVPFLIRACGTPSPALSPQRAHRQTTPGRSEGPVQRRVLFLAMAPAQQEVVSLDISLSIIQKVGMD